MYVHHIHAIGNDFISQAKFKISICSGLKAPRGVVDLIALQQNIADSYNSSNPMYKSTVLLAEHRGNVAVDLYDSTMKSLFSRRMRKLLSTNQIDAGSRAFLESAKR